MSRRCITHNSEWMDGKRACEYFFIWCRDVAGLEDCKEADDE